LNKPDGGGPPHHGPAFKGESKLNLNDIVLGWNGDREAARAAFDALPFLKTAKKVRIVRTDPQKDPSLKGSVAGADLAETLARHGVKAEAASFPTAGEDAGHALLRCADDSGCDLIVMGAYGHSRLREYIFGGATVCPEPSQPPGFDVALNLALNIGTATHPREISLAKRISYGLP
jgi:nucleotide-binding universal stress UspA family protein